MKDMPNNKVCPICRTYMPTGTGHSHSWEDVNAFRKMFSPEPKEHDPKTCYCLECERKFMSRAKPEPKECEHQYLKDQPNCIKCLEPKECNCDCHKNRLAIGITCKTCGYNYFSHKHESKEALREEFSVSKWKEIGQKYGYWDYFKEEAELDTARKISEAICEAGIVVKDLTSVKDWKKVREQAVREEREAWLNQRRCTICGGEKETR